MIKVMNDRQRAILSRAKDNPDESANWYEVAKAFDLRTWELLRALLGAFATDNYPAVRLGWEDYIEIVNREHS